MVALVFEVYGAFCLFSLIAFLVLAAVAKLRPDLARNSLISSSLRSLRSSSTLSGLTTLSRSSLDHRRAILVAAAPPGQAEQASDPKASAPDPYAQASHDLIWRHEPAIAQLLLQLAADSYPRGYRGAAEYLASDVIDISWSVRQRHVSFATKTTELGRCSTNTRRSRKSGRLRTSSLTSAPPRSVRPRRTDDASLIRQRFGSLSIDR